MRFKIDWASLIVGSKFTIFALFYLVLEGNFPITSPREAYIWTGDLTEGFLHYRFGGLIFGGAYFRNFTVLKSVDNKQCVVLLLLDLSTLFDTVDHEISLHRLRSKLDMKGKVLA